MSDKNDKGSFWTTLPGCLTGVAALITAIVGLLALLYQISGHHPDNNTPMPTPDHSKRENNNEPVHKSGAGTPTPDYSMREINNNDPDIKYSSDCVYNHGLSGLLYNDDVQMCRQQGDSFTYTFTGKNIYLVTVYHKGHGGTISCGIDGNGTYSYNLDSSEGVDSSGFAYGVVRPIAPTLVYGQHTAFCKMTSANTEFFIDALIVNK